MSRVMEYNCEEWAHLFGSEIEIFAKRVQISGESRAECGGPGKYRTRFSYIWILNP